MEPNTPRPPLDQRAEKRRAQIVDAARQCVVRRGFHASTIADIAATAKMSVGLIYRYFENKDAIALAIVESVVNRRNAGPMPHQPDELSAGFAQLILSEPPPDQREDQMLLLEVHVEATRNPVVAQIIERTDVAIRERFLADVYKDFPAFDPEEAVARMEMLAAIVYGTAMRRLARPGPPSDRLVAVYREMLFNLLQVKPTPPNAPAPAKKKARATAKPKGAQDAPAPAPATAPEPAPAPAPAAKRRR